MSIYLFIFFLFISDILETTGFHQFSMYVVFLIPAVSLLTIFLKGKKVSMPRGSVFFIAFMLLSMVSIFKAGDKEAAIEAFFLYAGTFFTFLIVFNNRKYFESTIKKYVLITSAVFVAIFVIGRIIPVNLFPSGLSLFYYYGHNQLGNLLLLPFFITFPGPSSLLFFIFILVSYSRTTYLAIFLAIVWQMKDKLVRSRAALAAILVLSVFAVLMTGNYYFSKDKTPFGSREMYFSYAIDAIRENPLTGVGPGNFYLAASARQTNYNENTTSSHNIILDVFAENGIFAGIFFTLFLIYIIKKGRRNVYFYSFVALTIVFLFDFTHRYGSFLTLWFFLAALIIDEEKTFSLKPLVIVILLVAYQPILIGQVFHNFGLNKRALSIYPLRKHAYPPVIVEAIERGDREEASKYLADFSRYYGKDFDSTYKIARYYEYLQFYDKSIYFYQKTLILRPFLLVADQIILDRIYAIAIATYGPFNGKIMTEEFLNGLIAEKSNMIKRINLVFDDIGEFCDRNQLKCYNIGH